MATKTRIPPPIRELKSIGQSLWLDNIRRQLITSGELGRLRDEGISGVTSNPTIFEKAVSGSDDYDEAMVRLVRAGQKPEQILWELMVEDVSAAADVFRPIYDRTKGLDGFVSIEVSPTVANSTRRTIAYAEDLRTRCHRPNVMVKIPATKEGIPAIYDQISKGHNINITLISSVDGYGGVVEAYLSGLEKLHKGGGDLRKVASVASFFVSRLDTKIDKTLAQKIELSTDPAQKRALEQVEEGGRPAAASPVGEHVDEGSALSRHLLRRGAHRSGHRRHDPTGHPGRFQRARRGAAEHRREPRARQASVEAARGRRRRPRPGHSRARGRRGRVLHEIIREPARHHPQGEPEHQGRQGPQAVVHPRPAAAERGRPRRAAPEG